MATEESSLMITLREIFLQLSLTSDTRESFHHDLRCNNRRCLCRIRVEANLDRSTGELRIAPAWTGYCPNCDSVVPVHPLKFERVAA